WEEFAKENTPNWQYWERKGFQLPVGVCVSVKDSLKLAMFLSAVKVFVEKAAPNLVKWESLTHKDIGYVKLSPTNRGETFVPWLAIYSVPLPDMWLLTLNEKVAMRAIERHVERKANPDAAAKWKSPLSELSANVAFKIDPTAVQFLRDFWGHAALKPLQ